MLQWLEINVEPWEKVCNYWMLTYDTRRQNATTNETNKLVYFKYLPVRSQQGTELVRYIFQILI